MKEDVELLRKEFYRIKDLNMVKALRKGTTGVGYTFESLIGKDEDKETKPDFHSIELKCKLGYSKSPMTLFNCAPKRGKEYATKYIFEKYGHYRYGNKNDIKLFSREVYSNCAIERYGTTFKLEVDYYNQ